MAKVRRSLTSNCVCLHKAASSCLITCAFLILFLILSDGPFYKRKQPADHQAPPSSDLRPPSPPGPPPPPGLAACDAQPNQDISPTVAAALLQIISQQEPNEAPQRSKDPSPGVEPPTQPPPPKPSAETPAGLGTTARAQFPKDQDLRFHHGTAR